MINVFTISDKNIIQHIIKELNQIEENSTNYKECKLVDTRDLLVSWCYILVSFQEINVEFFAKTFEAVNGIDSKIYNMNEKEAAHLVLKAIHQKLFPKSATDQAQLDLELKENFHVGAPAILRLLINSDKSIQIFKPELVPETGQIDKKLCDHLINLVQSPIPVMDIIKRKKDSNFSTSRQKGLAKLYHTLISRLPGDEYVTITHILPHLQVHTSQCGKVKNLLSLKKYFVKSSL